MKINGIVLHEGERIHINETNMNQLIFQHKNKKTQLLITILQKGKPLTFPTDMIEELTIAHIEDTNFN